MATQSGACIIIFKQLIEQRDFPSFILFLTANRASSLLEHQLAELVEAHPLFRLNLPCFGVA